MRLNDDGITEVLTAIQNKWGYLKVSSSGDSKVLTLISATISTNTLILVYRLSFVDMNGEDIISSALTQTSGATTLESLESFSDISKIATDRYTFTYTINFNR